MSYGVGLRNGVAFALGTIPSLTSGGGLRPSLLLNFLSGTLDSHNLLPWHAGDAVHQQRHVAIRAQQPADVQQPSGQRGVDEEQFVCADEPIYLLARV